MVEFQRELLDRLPLAEAGLKLFEHVLDEQFLEGVFKRRRGRCYHKRLSFSNLVWLIRDALVMDHGSGHKSLQRAAEERRLPVKFQNAYGKLSRIPLDLSTELLAEGTKRLNELMPETGTKERWPKSLRRFELMVIDGKKLKNSAKRLKPLRGLPGKVLGGKLLVALSLRKGLAVAMNADPDGERNDVPLTPGLVEQVRRLEKGAVLWIADRQFSDLGLPALFCEGEDHFVVRRGKRLKFHVDPEAGRREGREASGRRYVEEWGYIGGEKDARRRYVRQITLYREGEEDVAIITDLLDAAEYPATDLLAVYLERWGIERVFQQVTEVFELRRLIGSSPWATIFQGAMCLLLYNLLQVVRGYAAEAGGKSFDEVSTENLFDDMHREMSAWAKLGDPRETEKLLPAAGEPSELRWWLRRRLKGKWTRLWLKSPPKKKKAQTRTPTPAGHGGHTSAWKVIMASKGGKI